VIILVLTRTVNIPAKAGRIYSETKGMSIKTWLLSIKKVFYTSHKAME
jgi:hypothetical protein